MKSGALHHFPPLLQQGDKKILWNRLSKKPLANRPEERVRLQFIDYLTLEHGWPSSRIAVEQQVGRSRGKSQRADLVCYGKDFHPEILIECKAGSVSLSAGAAEQITRYNRQIQSTLLCITNGVEDHWYEICEGVVRPKKTSPFETGSSRNYRQNPEYWKARGFAGPQLLQKFPAFSGVLDHLCFDSAKEPIRYLDFQDSLQGLGGIDLSHYYRQIPLEKSVQLAVTCLSTKTGETLLISFCNQHRKNRGVLVVNLDTLYEGAATNGTLFHSGGHISVDIRNRLHPFSKTETSTEYLETLTEGLISLFSPWLT